MYLVDVKTDNSKTANACADHIRDASSTAASFVTIHAYTSRSRLADAATTAPAISRLRVPISGIRGIPRLSAIHAPSYTHEHAERKQVAVREDSGQDRTFVVRFGFDLRGQGEGAGERNPGIGEDPLAARRVRRFSVEHGEIDEVRDACEGFERGAPVPGHGGLGWLKRG